MDVSCDICEDDFLSVDYGVFGLGEEDGEMVRK